MGTFIKNKAFRVITISDWISVFGDSIFFLAFLDFAASLDNREFAITLVTIGETIPNVLSVFAGFLCDRTKNKYLADIGCAIIRAGMYLLVGFLFYQANAQVILYGVIILNFVSDFLGNYSDCLRFPEIYALVEDNEFESSNGFSSGIYYSFSVVGKLLGGIILVVLSHNYTKVAIANSITFLICGLLMLLVFSDVSKKMSTYEPEKQENSNTIFGELKKICNNRYLFIMLIRFAILNAVIESSNYIMYIQVANYNEKFGSKYIIYVSIIEGVSIIGLILGNILVDRIFKNVSIIELSNTVFFIVIIGLIMLYSKKILLIGVSFFMIFFLQGSLSIKFTSYIYSNQDYEALGISAGIINTMLTISIPTLWIVISSIGNFFSFDIALVTVCLLCLLTLLLSLSKSRRSIK